MRGVCPRLERAKFQASCSAFSTVLNICCSSWSVVAIRAVGRPVTPEVPAANAKRLPSWNGSCSMCRHRSLGCWGSTFQTPRHGCRGKWLTVEARSTPLSAQRSACIAERHSRASVGSGVRDRSATSVTDPVPSCASARRVGTSTVINRRACVRPMPGTNVKWSSVSRWA